MSVYLSSLPVAQLSDASRRRLVVTGDSAGISKAGNFYESVARIGTTRVVQMGKLVVNWREVCVNLSWLRAMSGQENWKCSKFWTRQNFATGWWTMRKLFVNSSGRCGRMRASAWQCAPCHDYHELPRIVHEQLRSSSRHVNEQFTNISRSVHYYSRQWCSRRYI